MSNNAILAESLRAAVGAIRAHGMRSVLTTLGIVIGIASVIAVVAVVQGLTASIDKQLAGMGTNVLSISPYTPLKDQITGNFARLREEDVDSIRGSVSGVANVTVSTPLVGTLSTLSYQGRKASAIAAGVGYAYADLYGAYTDKGRFFSKSDEQSRRRVTVLGKTVVSNLKIVGDPIGQYLQLGQEWFKVIGVLEERGKFFGFDQDDQILIPYSTARALQGFVSTPNLNISMAITDLGQQDKVVEQLKRVLRRNHGLAKDAPDDFELQTAKQMQERIGAITNTTTLVAAGVVGVSLLVGGIGIMNIMLVSVTERTREIGILKALGATRAHILWQFLAEAVLLCLLGGMIGLALGYGLALAVTAMIPGMPAATVPWWAIALSLSFSAFVGVLFGILPAIKAANLHPIDALRYE
ncbi:ABC transporter permease [Gallaecimonas xiamenensis]|uniref:ABC transporter permease n=1 Tax=Gallaecimonas xiamenensis 3-C-1 TaxID=745411 RepID=K2J147_9GAMM|nr:ABC transporter permease [Gallaecimonas xiamenensis]EKE76631.1 ABC transporter permease [Gallaecimonas xiamenensis 3-C-1]